MKHLVLALKVAIILLIVGYLILYRNDLLEVQANAGLLDKLLLTTPVLLVLRISIISIAFGAIVLIISSLWKGIGIVKVTSSGVELGSLNDFSSKAEEELQAKTKRIYELEAEVKALKADKDELRRLANVINPKKKGERR